MWPNALPNWQSILRIDETHSGMEISIARIQNKRCPIPNDIALLVERFVRAHMLVCVHRATSDDLRAVGTVTLSRSLGIQRTDVMSK